MKVVTTEEFDILIQSEKRTVFVDFFANWCGPCKMLSPVLEKLSAAYEGKAVFVKVDVDENAQLADRYGIYSIPNVKAIKEGKIIDEKAGYAGEDEMNGFVKRNV